MASQPSRPTALTIAGSDSGGGAGVQADLKAFSAAGVHGTTAVTCITAQNPQEISAIETVSPTLVDQQIAAVCSAFPVGAIKTGMLYSRDLVLVTARWITRTPQIPWVIDPVLVATSGALLLKPDALDAYKTSLFPHAALLTPNIAEAETLVGHKITDPEAMREAARILFKNYGVPILIKGGHLASGSSALDLLYTGNGEWLLQAPRVQGVRPHGTGCTFAAFIAAHLALGKPLPESVMAAKKMVTNAIRRSFKTGRQQILNP